MRLKWACLAALAACLILVEPGIIPAAQVQRVRLDVKVALGFSGYYYPGVPTPIFILLRNQGPLLQGQLIVYQEVKSPWRGVFRESFTLPIKLPHEAERLLQFYFPIHGYIYPLHVQLWDRDKILIYQKEIDLRERYREERLVLFLSDSRALAQAGELPTGERPLWVEPALLPTRWFGYLGVRRIYLGQLSSSALSPQQWEAIVEWLRWGGELVIFAGENWYWQRNPLLEELLPLKIQKMADWEGQVIVLGEPHGEIIYRSREGQPLLLAARRGRGRVIFSAVNPLSGHIERENEFWQRLAASLAGVDREIKGPTVPPGLQQALALLRRQELVYPQRLPLAGLYFLFVGGFALIGLLVRQRRAIFLLLWTAGMALLAGLYLGSAQHARPLLAFEVGIVHDMGRLSLSSTWYRLFAKRALTLSLPLADEGYLIQLIPKERGEHLYDLDYFHGPSGEGARVRLERWMGRYFYQERFISDLADLQIEGKGGKLKVRATDKGPESLHDCALRNGGRFYSVGDLPPGKAVEAEFEPDHDPRVQERPPWLTGRLEELYRLAKRERDVKEPFLLCWGKLKELDMGGKTARLAEREALKLILIEEDEDRDAR